jgi:peptidyl-prolyl cis-trans isomerase A (cyclophilin A)
VTLNDKAPDVFHVKFETTKGDFTMRVTRAWAPLGADRFYNLVRHHFYDGASFFRVLDGFVVQFGISAYPPVSAAWKNATIKDDTVTQSNKNGYVCFATGGPNTRTTQVFINLGDNSRLDRMGFSPFGQVIEGMTTVVKLYSGYGEGAPSGGGPSQDQLEQEGKAYIDREFPKLDRIISSPVTDDPLPAVVPMWSPVMRARSAAGEATSISGEVARIERGKHSALPPPVASPLEAGSSYGSINRKIENGTSYTLTVLFAGPVERKITLAAGQTGELVLPAGNYKVAAHVTAPNVLPFFGTQSYSSGQEYTSHFYIQ